MIIGKPVDLDFLAAIEIADLLQLINLAASRMEVKWVVNLVGLKFQLYVIAFYSKQ